MSRTSANLIELRRSGTARWRAAWDEFDVEAAVRTVPAAHMKRLASAPGVAVDRGAGGVGRGARGLSGDGLAFRGPGGGELGKSTVPEGLRKADIGATARGFRSSFKDWARHEGVDELLSEFALAHVEVRWSPVFYSCFVFQRFRRSA